LRAKEIISLKLFKFVPVVAVEIIVGTTAVVLVDDPLTEDIPPRTGGETDDETD
jgi:hypothetical protein